MTDFTNYTDKKIATLKKGECFCFSCDKKIKSKNIEQHNASVTHNKNVDRVINKAKKRLNLK